MKSSIYRRTVWFLLMAIFVGVIACQGAVVTFAPAQAITGDADVAVNGTPVYAYSMGSATLGSGSHTVNGVDFVGVDPGANAAGTVTAGSLSFVNWNSGIHATIFGSASAPFSALSANYQSILQSAKFDSRDLDGPEGVKVVLNGLQDGEDYQVQLWANVSLAQSRTMSWIGDGGTAGTLSDNPSGSTGGVGQHIIGTFTASGTSQDLNLSSSSTWPKINALSLRMTSSPTILENGDFEEGSLTGWTNTASATINSNTPLADSHSAVLPNDVGAGSPQTLAQSFATQINPVTLSFDFSMPQPASRGLQLYLKEDTGTGQVNLQVNSAGDVQIYDTTLAGWQTVLTDAVTFDTNQTLSLTVYGYGADFDYDLTVGGQSASGLSFWQNSVLDDFNELAFVNEWGNTGYEIDDVLISPAQPKPEPQSGYLFSLIGRPVELWDHLSSASELEDVRDMAATFDDSGARRVLQLNVSNPVSWAQGAWLAVPPPEGGWNLANVQNVEASIKNTGAAAVNTLLWVVASNGWAAVGDETTLGAGQTTTLSCNLRQTYPDGTPRIDPGQVKHIRIMTQRATTASLEVTGLSASGTVGDWVRPAGHLDVPDMVEGAPAAGKRVRYQLAADAGTDIYCALYLPTDWQLGNTYPVIAETPGNYFYSATACWSTGRPEQCAMGYGASSGTNAIWVSLPFVDRTAGTIAENGFGSNDGADTITYVQDVIDDVCQNWGGDTNNLFLSGFSRGAIACGYIGLANDDIAALWKGFIACQHYDGSAWNQSNMAGAIARAPRFQGEAIFQVDNTAKVANYEQLMETTDPSVVWTWVDSGLGYHSTAMFLDDRASMIQLRQWFNDLTAE